MNLGLTANNSSDNLIFNNNLNETNDLNKDDKENCNLKSNDKNNLKKEPTAETKTQEVSLGAVFVSIGVLAAFACAAVVVEVAFVIKEIMEEKIWRPNPVELEKKLSEKFSSEFIQKIKNMTLEGVHYVRLFRRLTLSQEDEIAMLTYLETHFEISKDEFQKILMGAHVRLEDAGKSYDEWVKTMSHKKLRLSSHPSDKSQYAVRGSLIKELLFSRMNENGQAYTWFQLENHPVSLGYIIRHMKDYLKFKITSKNQGPYGSCDATHHAPLILKFKQKTDKEPTK